MFRFWAEPLSRNRLIVCILINLLATPGLGSLMARRIIAGTAQLLLALAGCGLIIVWMAQLFYRLIAQLSGEAADYPATDWLWNRGLLLLGASWIWGLVTSVSLLIQAGKLPANAGLIPPRIEDVSDGS